MVKGANGAVIGGDAESNLTVYALDFGDTASLVCQPVNFRIPLDSATPQLFTALNQRPTSVIFTEVPTKSPTTLRKFVLTVTAPQITTIHSVASTTVGPYDDISLKPSALTLTYTQNSAGATPVTSTVNCR